MKVAIAILSDPALGEESLGRVLNALVLATDLKQREAEVQIFFQGTGTRWVNLLEQADHPGFGLFQNLKQCKLGASSACAEVFKANITTIPLLKEFDIPGLGSASSLATAMSNGFELITF